MSDDMMPQPRYLAAATGAINPGQPSPRPTTTVDSGVVATMSRKRQRTTDGDEGEGHSKLAASGGLACPFYKNNTNKHVNCLGYASFLDFKQLKQHLDRCHSWPDYYCPSCKMTFGDKIRTDKHIVARSCAFREASYPGAVSPEQREKIDKISADRKGRKSADEKWFMVWDILFPGGTRPNSARRLSVEHETALNVQHFAQSPAGYRVIQESGFLDRTDDVLAFLVSMLKAFADNAQAARIVTPENPSLEDGHSSIQYGGGNIWPEFPFEDATSSFHQGGVAATPTIPLVDPCSGFTYGGGYSILEGQPQEDDSHAFSFDDYLQPNLGGEGQ